MKLKDEIEAIILPMMNLSNKLVLTGSISLNLLGVDLCREVGDIDLGLTSMLTKEEYMYIIDHMTLS